MGIALQQLHSFDSTPSLLSLPTLSDYLFRHKKTPEKPGFSRLSR
jgi:hypothetical protein